MRQIKCHAAFPIQPLAQRPVHGAKRRLFLLVIHAHVVQRRSIHPIRQHSPNDAIAKRDQVERRLIFLRRCRRRWVLADLGNGRWRRRRIGLLGRRRVGIAAGILVDDHRRRAAGITRVRITIGRVPVARRITVATVAGVIAIEERIARVEKRITVEAAKKEWRKTKEAIAAESEIAEVPVAAKTPTEAAPKTSTPTKASASAKTSEATAAHPTAA